jgi:hypothetical protein
VFLSMTSSLLIHMLQVVLWSGLLAGIGNSLQWGRFPVPSQLGLTEVMGRFQTTDSSSSSSSGGGIVDQINTVIASAASSVNQSQTFVTAQLNELNVTNGMINRTVQGVSDNEAKRIGLIKDFNGNVMSLNTILVDMTTGSQQINDVISTANRIKTNIANDIKKINDAINVTNDWMTKMDSWVAFVKSETSEIDQAQANLVTWGDSTKNNINLHEVAAVKLAREIYDLETTIADMSNYLLGTGTLFGYTPTTLTMAEASGGLGWQYSYWS